MNRPSAMFVVGLVLASAPPSRAQSAAWTDRAYVSVNGTYQATSTTFTDVVHPVAFVEPSVISTAYEIGAALGFDVGGGYRVWRNLAAGVDVSRISKSGDSAVSAQIPHPFLFNQRRSVPATASGVNRQETAVHVQASWVMPLRRRWRIAVSGGPTWFMIAQDLVQDINVSQTYPYDTATSSGVISQRQSRSRLGFNAGTDVVYLFARHVGVGMSGSYSLARIALPSDNTTVTVDAGGVRVGGSLRLRF
jgi:outer membrane protein with beta-barrel domain